MKVLRQLTLRTLKLNRKRTLVTIVGIMLATALITAVANMAESFRASMIAYEKVYSGDFHYAFHGVGTENLKFFEHNRYIEKTGYAQNVGYAAFPEGTNPDKPYLFISAYDENAIRAASLFLTEGRLPENDGEILVSNHIRRDSDVNYEIGDILTLQMGTRVAADGTELNQYDVYQYEAEKFCPMQEKQFTVVGLIERPSNEIEGRMSPGYTLITYLSEPAKEEKLTVYASYTHAGLKNRDEVTAGILGLPVELYERYLNRGVVSNEEYEQLFKVASYVQSNVWLLKWELLQFSGGTMNMLYSMAGIAIFVILLTSVFCIRNSFSISLTEKMRLYGMLSSVGMTKKQRKKLVYYEAMLLGAIGIPLGIACGAAACAIVVRITGGLLETAMGIRLIYKFSIPAIIIGAVLAVVTIFLSAAQSARRAGKISPISAIRANDSVKIGKNRLKTPKLIQKVFGTGGVIAYKNLRRARGKYRTTVISIVVSVVVFIGMSSFIRLGFSASTAYYGDCEYQIRVSFYGKGCYEQAESVTQFDGIEKATVIRNVPATLQNSELPYRQEFLDTVNMVAPEEYVVRLISIGERAYKELCEKIGMKEAEAEGKAILINQFFRVTEDGVRVTGKWFDCKDGTVIHAKMQPNEEETELTIAAQTTEYPMGVYTMGTAIFVVSDAWMSQNIPEDAGDNASAFLQCSNADEMEEAIRADKKLEGCSIQNMDREYRRMQSLYLLISIFLYGFITVIALIGITNIFNTITTNMELRSREFAMLKSIGMTGREFRRMIWLESFFYGTKALLIGIPGGILLSWEFTRAMSGGVKTEFRLPYESILIAVVAVFVLIFSIMQYSMKKANSNNMIETIQKENI